MYVIGIDFGTSNSCVSFYDPILNGIPDILTFPDGKRTCKTQILFNKNSDEILFGDPCVNKNDYTIIQGIKRLVGLSFNKYASNKQLVEYFENLGIHIECDRSVEDYIPESLVVNVSDTKKYTIHELVVMFFEYIKGILTETGIVSDNNSNETIVTVPAYFDDIQKNIINMSASKVGFFITRLIAEPTSAMLCYISTNEDIKNSTKHFDLVLDCGGGTTDISVVKVDNTTGIHNVVNTWGDNFLGGGDITEALANHVSEKLNFKNRDTLTRVCELAKQELTFKENIIISNDANMTSISMSRAKFNDVCSEFFKKIKAGLETVLYNKHTLAIYNISNVVLVGGSSVIPKIKEIVAEVLPFSNVITSVNPDTSISVGACIQAGINYRYVNDIDTEDDITLCDILNLSLGVKVRGGIMANVISSSSKIPTVATQTFTNSENYTDTIILDVYQGEHVFVKDNTYITSIELKGINPELKRGEALVDVTFEVDSSGQLKISAETHATVNKETISETCVISLNRTYRPQNDDEPLLDKLNEIEMKDTMIAKDYLFDTFKECMVMYREVVDDIHFEFTKASVQGLFNETFNVISRYAEYTSYELYDITDNFKTVFNDLMTEDRVNIDYNM